MLRVSQGLRPQVHLTVQDLCETALKLPDAGHPDEVRGAVPAKDVVEALGQRGQFRLNQPGPEIAISRVRPDQHLEQTDVQRVPGWKPGWNRDPVPDKNTELLAAIESVQVSDGLLSCAWIRHAA